MNQISFIRLFVLLGCGLLIVAILGCSEKVVNESDLPGDGNLVIDLQLSPAETMALVDLYLLTVTAPDMDRVVDTLRLVEGHYVVGNVQVPIGERRLFVLEGLGQISSGERPVIYRGRTVAPVRPGVITTLNIVLRPVVPMVKLSPVYTEIAPYEGLALELKVFNVPNLVAFRVDFHWTDYLLSYPSVTLPESYGEGVVFDWWSEGSWMGLQVADTTGGTIVDDHGNGILARLSFQALTQASAQPPVIIEITGGYGVTSTGDTVGAGTIFIENAEARLIPVADREVVFPDLVLDRVIRDLTSVQTPQPIMLSDVLPYTYLNFADLGVEVLTGLENMTNLTYLYMSWNPIVGISLLADLTRMRYLYAESNGISDLSPLAGMTEMRALDLDANWITDITPLAGMTELSSLYLSVNQITDISVLQGLTNLYYLDLHSNQISDILPLVNNPGLGSGDVVELWNNTALIGDTIQQGHVATLRGREVTVYMDQPGK